MATYNVNTFNFDLSTDANYQALWGAVDTQIQGLGGWTYTSQTGDGNPASTATGAAGTYPAFRCYSTTVGGQTWYMRIDYGHTTNGPALKFQFGTTVNGSGTLGGQTSTQQTAQMSSGSTGTNKSVYLSQAAGRIALRLVNSASPGNEWWFSIHAYVDSSGAMTANGMMFLAGLNSTRQTQPVPVSGTIPAVLNDVPVNGANQADTTVGTHVMTFHPFLWDETGGLNVNAAVAVMGTTNNAANFTATASLYGTTRTWLGTGYTGPSSMSSLRLLILWE